MYPYIQQMLAKPELRADEAHVEIEPFATSDTKFWVHLAFKPGSGRQSFVALGNSIPDALASLNKKLAHYLSS